jgi:hypothetical protein
MLPMHWFGVYCVVLGVLAVSRVSSQRETRWCLGVCGYDDMCDAW